MSATMNRIKSKATIVLALLFSLQVLPKAEAQPRGSTQWVTKEIVGRLTLQYRVNKVSWPVVYAEERMLAGGKLMGRDYRWNVDCQNKIMHGEYMTWSKKGNLWVGQKGQPATHQIEENFNLYCSHGAKIR
jgi:hypothetical protein